MKLTAENYRQTIKNKSSIFIFCAFSFERTINGSGKLIICFLVLKLIIFCHENLSCYEETFHLISPFALDSDNDLLDVKARDRYYKTPRQTLLKKYILYSNCLTHFGIFSLSLLVFVFSPFCCCWFFGILD